MNQLVNFYGYEYNVTAHAIGLIYTGIRFDVLWYYREYHE
jgi:hypothetical protein